MDATRSHENRPVQADARPNIMPRGFRGSSQGRIDRHWVRKDPYATAFFNALSAVFPHGETFMIRCMIPWAKRVPAPLAREINAFIEQEAGHSREHVSMNRQLIDAGYDIEPLDRKIRGFVRFFENSSDIVKLTATMCIEHFTAIIAAELLANKHHLEGTDEELHDLWMWHALEEVEHKGVAYDVWKYATRDWNPIGRWIWRSFFMFAITISFFVNRTLGQLELLRQDGFSSFKSLMRVMKTGFGKGGIGRNVLRHWASFFRPGFHPWDIDDRLLVAEGEAALALIAAKRAGYRRSQASADMPTRVATAA